MIKKRKWSSVVMAGLMAFTIVAGSVTAVLPTTLDVSAGQQIGQLNFDDGIGLPWHICESGTAKLKFNIDGGSYNVTVEKAGGELQGGEDRWDCQFRHRGLKMVQGDVYHISFTITSTNAGTIYTKIGNLDAETIGSQTAGEIWHNGYTDGQGWNPLKLNAGKNTFDYTFTAPVSCDVVEWTFHFGGGGHVTGTTGQLSVPEGTVLSFDDMSLIDETSDVNDWRDPEPYVRKGIGVNQIGYFTDLKKQATLRMDTEDTTPKSFELLDASGTTVYTGTTTPKAGIDSDSGDYVQIMDFSEFTTAGKGYTLKCGDAVSYSFDIGTDVYAEAEAGDLLTNSLNYFYLNRSGIAIESKYITSGDATKLARGAGHPKDVAWIQHTGGDNNDGWVFQYAIDGSDVDRDKSQDVTGGWYDAGDYGKYVVNGGISVWTLQNIYERALANGTEAKYADGTMSIPENANGDPDLLDEARYEMEFFLKMIVKDGDYKGMAYHKMHDFKWTGLAVSPVDADPDLYRIIKPPTTAATLNLSACGAQSYRLWKDLDSSFATECLDAAKSAYVAAKAHPNMAAPLDQNKGGGPYGDTYFDDDFYWAACELWLATGDDTYYNDMKSSKHFLEMPTSLTGGENSGDVGSFNWGNTQGLGTASLATNYTQLSEADKKTVFSNITSAADYYIDLEDSQGYGLPFAQAEMKDIGTTGYTWGSNSFVVNNAIVMGLAYNITGDKDYASGASVAMDYIFGRNGADYSYVTNYGEHAVQWVHHRWWSNLLDSSFPKAPNGVLSGGPNSAMQDPYIQGMGYKVGEQAPQLCFLDHIEAWSVNECTINWNAPVVWTADFFDDYDSISAWDDSTPTETTTTETTTTTTETTTTTTETTTTTAETTTTTAPITTTTETTTTTTPDTSTSESETVDTDKVLYGDVNLDGKVNISDVIKFNKFLVKSTTLDATARENADCVYDSKLEIKDNFEIVRFICKIVSKLGPQ